MMQPCGRRSSNGVKVLTQGSSRGTIRRNQNCLLRGADMAVGNQPKDAWDKFGIATQFISGVVIAIAGGVFSYSYQSQQSARERQAAELQKVQTIGTFMPFLTSKDPET